MKKRFWLLSLLSLLLIGCNKVEKTEDFVVGVKNKKGETVQILNTTVFLRTYDTKTFDNLFPTYTSLIQRIHKESDRYNEYTEYSDIFKLNRDGSVSTNAEVIDIIDNVLELSALTDYKFNPSLGPLIDVWSPLFNNSNNTDPSTEDIENALSMIATSNIEDYFDIDRDTNTIAYKDKNLVLDLGAYVKGYALEKAYAAFSENDQPLMIYAGGSSIILKGVKPYANGNWIIDIDNPDNYLSSVAQLYLKGTHTISTSGDYQKYFVNDNGIRRHHILNPLTGYPIDTYRSITVYSNKRADVLDALTTALFNCSNDDEFKVLISKVEAHYDMEIEYIYVKEESGKNYLGVSKGAKDVIKNAKLEVREVE
jgi:thiamine biosynthesis lipoprotein